MNRTKWTTRTFDFSFPEGWLPNILERLRGTEPRLKAITANVSEEAAARQFNGKWSIKQEIGHLVDLEDLHINRIHQLMAKKTELEGWKVGNQQTHEANHNERAVPDLIQEFAEKRNEFVRLLSDLDDDTQLFSSLHPRLKVRMRPIDVGYFTAEHDDHHLASIRVVLEKLKEE